MMPMLFKTQAWVRTPGALRSGAKAEDNIPLHRDCQLGSWVQIPLILLTPDPHFLGRGESGNRVPGLVPQSCRREKVSLSRIGTSDQAGRAPVKITPAELAALGVDSKASRSLPGSAWPRQDAGSTKKWLPG